MNDKNTKIPVMRPYHDMHSPFSVGELGNFAEYIARDPVQFPELILGAFVLIRDVLVEITAAEIEEMKDIWAVGRVIELKAISPLSPHKESALYVEDDERDPAAVLWQRVEQDVVLTGHHTYQPMIARVRLENQMQQADNPNGPRRFVSLPIQRPPSAHSYLRFPDIKPPKKAETPPVPTLLEMLDIRENGVILGYVGQGNQPFQKGGDLLPYKWDVDRLDNKHMFIVGESGAGKTALLKNLAYQLRKGTKGKKPPRIIMTDVQGDISQLLLWDLDEKITLKPKHPWQQKLVEEGAKGHKMEVKDLPKKVAERFGKFRLVVPARKPGQHHSDRLSALMELAERRGHDVREIGLRMQDLSAPSDVEYLYGVTSEQVGLLLDKIAETELRGKKKLASLENLRDVIRSELRKEGGQRGSQASIAVGDTDFYKTTFGAATRALANLSEYFDHHQPSIKGAQTPLDVLNFDGTTILYLDDLDSERERIMWEMQLVKWLYDNRKTAGNSFVFIDEAHQIIPVKPIGMSARNTGTFDRLRINFERLAREGRKFNINLVLSTQSPRDLHPIVPEQCQTRMVMKINPNNAVAASLDKELAGITTQFDAGQFWIHSPFNGTPYWIRVHSSTSLLPHMNMPEYWDMVIDAARNLKKRGKN